MTVLTLRPRVPTVQAWQFKGQPWNEWPSWVIGEPNELGNEIIHYRPSGRQRVYWGEWLVRLPNGDVWWFTDEEIREWMES